VGHCRLRHRGDGRVRDRRAAAALFASQGAVWGGLVCAAGLLVYAWSLAGAVRKVTVLGG
jgi:hypothetical protein